MKNRKFMFDTNIFNKLLDDNNFFEKVMCLINKGLIEIFATEMQLEELRATKTDLRRNELCDRFTLLNPNMVPGIFMLNVKGCGFDQGAFATRDECDLYTCLVSDLREIDRKKRKKSKNHEENTNIDVNIMLTAHKNGLAIVNRDCGFLEVCKKYNINYIEYNSFLDLIVNL